mgnify:CR=1 FL=1
MHGGWAHGVTAAAVFALLLAVLARPCPSRPCPSRPCQSGPLPALPPCRPATHCSDHGGVVHQRPHGVWVQQPALAEGGREEEGGGGSRSEELAGHACGAVENVQTGAYGNRGLVPTGLTGPPRLCTCTCTCTCRCRCAPPPKCWRMLGPACACTPTCDVPLYCRYGAISATRMKLACEWRRRRRRRRQIANELWV